jgi:hypothetical protein
MRDQHTRGQLTAEALTAAGELASVNLIRDFDYLDFRCSGRWG